MNLENIAVISRMIRLLFALSPDARLKSWRLAKFLLNQTLMNFSISTRPAQNLIGLLSEVQRFQNRITS
jgi:hypothetical protein